MLVTCVCVCGSACGTRAYVWRCGVAWYVYGVCVLGKFGGGKGVTESLG